MLLILQSFKRVFKKPGYVILSVLVSGLILLISIWLSNSALLSYIFSSELFSWGAKLKILWTSLGTLNTNFNTANRILIIGLALLGGINVALLVFYIKNRAKVLKTAGMSGLGLGVGLLGIGCGACGSVILSSIFGLTIAVGFIGGLPLKGLEFGLVGIILILISIYVVAKRISQPEVC